MIRVVWCWIRKLDAVGWVLFSMFVLLGVISAIVSIYSLPVIAVSFIFFGGAVLIVVIRIRALKVTGG